jgi:hypothetical protein
LIHTSGPTSIDGGFFSPKKLTFVSISQKKVLSCSSLLTLTDKIRAKKLGENSFSPNRSNVCTLRVRIGLRPIMIVCQCCPAITTSCCRVF